MNRWIIIFVAAICIVGVAAAINGGGQRVGQDLNLNVKPLTKNTLHDHNALVYIATEMIEQDTKVCFWLKKEGLVNKELCMDTHKCDDPDNIVRQNNECQRWKKKTKTELQEEQEVLISETLDLVAQHLRENKNKVKIDEAVTVRIQ